MKIPITLKRAEYDNVIEFYWHNEITSNMNLAERTVESLYEDYMAYCFEYCNDREIGNILKLEYFIAILFLHDIAQ